MSSTVAVDPMVSSLLAEDPDMRDIVEEFAAGLPQRAADLEQAMAAQDWTRLATLAHQLKGAGGSYGYPQLSELGATMEHEFKNRSAGEFRPWMTRLGQLIEGVAAGLRN